MRENKISIVINKSPAEVFAFMIDPKNTPGWFDTIVKEEAEFPIGLGTKYVNFNLANEKGEYVVSKFEVNKLFQLDSLSSDYKVQYTLREISPSESELEYFEWVENGELGGPASVVVLEKLKGH